MRRATIEIRWEGPDKAMREYISERLDALFEEMTYEVSGVTFADASTRFESKIRTMAEPTHAFRPSHESGVCVCGAGVHDPRHAARGPES